MSKTGSGTMRGLLLALVAGVMLIAVGCGDDDSSSASGNGSTAPTEKLRVAYPGGTVSTMFTYIAESQGFFAEQGLDVDISDGTGANVSALLTSGRADIIQNAAPAALAIASQGKPTTVLWGMTGGGAVGQLAGNEESDTLEKLQALDECTIATFVPGSNTYGYAVAWKDAVVPKCEIQSFGDIELAIASATGGRADAVVASYSALQTPVTEERLNILVSADDIPGKLGLEPFAEAIEMGLTENLERKRSAVVKYLTAVQQARDWFAENSDEDAAKAISGFEVYKGRTLESLVDTVRFERPFMGQGTDRGRISETQWQLQLEAVTRAGAEGIDTDAPYAAYAERVDMSYLDAAGGEE